MGTVLPLLSSALGRNFLADVPNSRAEVEKMIAHINASGLSV